MSEMLPPIIVPPGGGDTIRAFGDEVRMHLSADQTGGSLSLWTLIVQPGGGPPPHYHLNEHEYFVVQEGRMSFFADGAWTEVAVGASVFLPRAAVHAFKNVGETPARLLVASSPGGFERFFTRCAEEFARPEGPDMARIMAISAEHGVHFT